MIQQSTPYGSGLFAVANAIEMPEFLRPERMEYAKLGLTFFDLSTFLFQDTGGQMILDPFWVDYRKGCRPPKWVREMRFPLDKQTGYVPMVFGTIRKGANSVHMVSGRIQPDDTFVLFDSLEGSPTVLNNLGDIIPKYQSVFAAYSVFDNRLHQPQVINHRIDISNN